MRCALLGIACVACVVWADIIVETLPISAVERDFLIKVIAKLSCDKLYRVESCKWEQLAQRGHAVAAYGEDA